MSMRNVTRQPKIVKTAKGVRISHRELYDASVPGSTAFTVQNTIVLNPGLAASFPWLAPQAKMWEQYVCHKLCAEWIPIAPTDTKGTVTLSPEYDSGDAAPTTEEQLSSAFGTVEDRVWVPIVLDLDTKSMMAGVTRKFVRSTNVAGDIKMFDVGKIFVASNNEANTDAIGKLWLSYDFEFFIPQNSPSTDISPKQTSYYGLAAAQTFTTATEAAIEWDDATYDPIGFGNPATGVFTPAAGVYRIYVALRATDTSSERFNAEAHFEKNTAALAPQVATAAEMASSTASAAASLSLVGVVAMNGTDTFQVNTTLVGAAGTLRMAGGCTMVVTLA